MYLSKQQGHSVSVKSVNTIASGLAPPYAGKEDCERNFQGLCSKIAQTFLCNTSVPHIAHGYLDMSVYRAFLIKGQIHFPVACSVFSVFCTLLYLPCPPPRSYELFKFTTRSFLLLPPRAESPISDQHYGHCLWVVLVRMYQNVCCQRDQQAGKKSGDHNVCLSRQSANLQRT